MLIITGNLLDVCCIFTTLADPNRLIE